MKVELVDWMGDDESVVDAARVSFDKRADNYSDEANIKLIRFLAREKHELPFAHTAMTLRCSAPVPIRTQCFKSKIGFVENEESRRYISSTPELFVPDEFRMVADDKKQGSGGKHHDSEGWKYTYINVAQECIDTYCNMISDGVCQEQARFILPQGVMVNWIWTGSLLAYARFYNLRSKPDAQKEVQVMAKKVAEVCAKIWPVSWEALTA